MHTFLSSRKIGKILKIFKEKSAVSILITVLIFSFLYRINTLYFLIEGNDAYRDYLIAHHILEYGEYPLIGPSSFLVSSFNNSPLYFYLLAIFLSLKDEFWFLGYINVLLYLLTIVIVYLIGKELFNSGVGIFSSILYSLSFVQFTNKQTIYIWQPWVMMPFVNLSFLLLVLFYKKKGYRFLLLSIITLIFSSALHPSVLSLIPFFFTLVFLLLRRYKFHLRFLVPMLTALFSYSLFYFPTFLYSKSSVFSGLTNRLQLAPAEMYKNFRENLYALLSIYSLNDKLISPFEINLLIIIILIVFLFSMFFLLRKNEPRYIVLFCFFIQPLIFTSLIKLYAPVHIGRYFIPALGLMFILITGVLYYFLSKNIVFKIISIFIMIILIKVLYATGIESALSGSNIDKPKMGDALQIMQQASDSIRNDIMEIKSQQNLQDYGFFKIRAYRADEVWSNALFWMYLEKDLNRRFIKTSNDTPVGFIELNNERYIFLVCYKFLSEDELGKCSNTFFEEYPDYKISKQVYSHPPFVIYQTRIID